ncbi:hypothetical protein CCB80_04295 [Armatimonadetes bacterium Uphvl-Ar1]|nr:hypothetical protein CCB80_04295 [Armatimonadetes bacterium Uphvl-Ar1]
MSVELENKSAIYDANLNYSLRLINEYERTHQNGIQAEIQKQITNRRLENFQEDKQISGQRMFEYTNICKNDLSKAASQMSTVELAAYLPMLKVLLQVNPRSLGVGLDLIFESLFETSNDKLNKPVVEDVLGIKGARGYALDVSQSGKHIINLIATMLDYCEGISNSNIVSRGGNVRIDSGKFTIESSLEVERKIEGWEIRSSKYPMSHTGIRLDASVSRFGVKDIDPENLILEVAPYMKKGEHSGIIEFWPLGYDRSEIEKSLIWIDNPRQQKIWQNVRHMILSVRFASFIFLYRSADGHFGQMCSDGFTKESTEGLSKLIEMFSVSQGVEVEEIWEAVKMSGSEQAKYCKIFAIVNGNYYVRFYKSIQILERWIAEQSPGDYEKGKESSMTEKLGHLRGSLFPGEIGSKSNPCEVDAMFLDQDVCIVVELKSKLMRGGVLSGNPIAVSERNELWRSALSQAERKANLLWNKRDNNVVVDLIGRPKIMVPIVVSDHVELPPFEKKFWLTEYLPRVMSVEEFKDVYAKWNSSQWKRYATL